MAICKFCGGSGDLTRSACSRCPDRNLLEAASDDEAKVEGFRHKQHQEEMDRRMAEELHALQVEEAQLSQHLLLQELEAEEMILQGLLNEQRALQLAEKYAAKAAKQASVKPAPATEALEDVPMESANPTFLQQPSEQPPQPSPKASPAAASPLPALPYGPTACIRATCNHAVAGRVLYV